MKLPELFNVFPDEAPPPILSASMDPTRLMCPQEQIHALLVFRMPGILQHQNRNRRAEQPAPRPEMGHGPLSVYVQSQGFFLPRLGRMIDMTQKSAWSMLHKIEGGFVDGPAIRNTRVQ